MRPADCVVRDVLAPHPALDSLWASIVAPESVKARLLHQSALGLNVRRKLPFETTALHGLVLMHGPPGTGKTTLAQGLPSRLAGAVGGQVRLLEINPHGLMSADHGRSQQNVNELLLEVVPERADDGKPTVLLLDEVESMAVARSEASLGANPVDVHRATDAVLTAMDALTRSHPRVLTVATSNFTSGLDEAFISRTDASILVPLPSQEALREILRQTLTEYGEAYPPLIKLAQSAALIEVARSVLGIDGRAARKLIVEAAAARLETAIDPGLLTIDDLRGAARRIARLGSQEVADAAA